MSFILYWVWALPYTEFKWKEIRWLPYRTHYMPCPLVTAKHLHSTVPGIYSILIVLLRCVFPMTACAIPGRDLSTAACAAPGRVYFIAACAFPGRVCSTVACAVPACVFSIEACSVPWLWMLFSILCVCVSIHQPVLSKEVSGLLCFTWTYLFNRSLCFARRCPVHSSLCCI